MNDDYRLLRAPWHGEPCDTPLRAGNDDSVETSHAVRAIDEVCEQLTTCYIAENMGDRAAYLQASRRLQGLMRGMSDREMQEMVMVLVSPHATARAEFAVDEIPSGVPAEWLKGGTS